MPNKDVFVRLLKLHKKVVVMNFGTFELLPFKNYKKTIVNFEGEKAKILKKYRLKFKPSPFLKNNLFYEQK